MAVTAKQRGRRVGRKPDTGTLFGAARLPARGSSPQKEFTSVSVEAYRRNAADCLKMSLAAADPEIRGLLKRMAIAWTNLAEQAESETLQSIVQQLQQPQSTGLDFDVLTPEEQRRALDG
jgi:hypothetical protein